MGADLFEWLCERWPRAKDGGGTSSGVVIPDIDDMSVLGCSVLPMMVPTGTDLQTTAAWCWRQMFTCLLT